MEKAIHAGRSGLGGQLTELDVARASMNRRFRNFAAQFARLSNR
ncbi:MAG: hypothetical protein ACI82A_002578 [Candidatus Azotimanducaceae bacterium]|jgi:hypothetical protein